jgi:hypothetical protein
MQQSSLFDDLVGDGEHTWRHLDVERSRRLQVDDELELGRLHDRQVGGFGADSVFRTGAPRSMNLGNIASPCLYDVAAYSAPRLSRPRRLANLFLDSSAAAYPKYY